MRDPDAVIADIDKALADRESFGSWPDLLAEARTAIATLRDERDNGDSDGTPDEKVCGRCGGANPNWFAPDWFDVVGSTRGILCPNCFMAINPHTLFMVQQHTAPNASRLTAFLQQITDLGDDAPRVATCVLDWMVGRELEAQRDAWRTDAINLAEKLKGWHEWDGIDGSVCCPDDEDHGPLAAHDALLAAHPTPATGDES